MTPDVFAVYAATEATWPPAEAHAAGPWVLRNGAGGGKRVSAATARDEWSEDDLSAAEAAMKLLDQPSLFMIRQGDDALDAALAKRGYEIIDPVNIWLCPIATLMDRPVPRVTAFCIWEPLAIMLDIWEAGGIGPARIAVMERVKGPKTGLLGRIDDTPGGTAFCAVDRGIAMVHALEIAEHSRKKGLGGWMMRQAAFWAADHGAEWMSVLCTQANTGANRLYASLGMEVVGQYHYRILNNQTDTAAK